MANEYGRAVQLAPQLSKLSIAAIKQSTGLTVRCIVMIDQGCQLRNLALKRRIIGRYGACCPFARRTKVTSLLLTQLGENLRVIYAVRNSHMLNEHQSGCRSRQLWLLRLLLFLSVTFKTAAQESPGKISSAEIVQSVVSSLPKTPGTTANVITSLDLTRPFETQSQWTFAAVKLPGFYINGVDTQPVDGGALARCFVEDLIPHCKYETPKNDADWSSMRIEIYSAKVVFSGSNNTRPLLLIKTGSAHGGNGSHGIYTELFTYDRQSNVFYSVFSNATGSNNNQETRFIEDGPLRGDVVVAEPTSSAPFGFWISIYASNAKDVFSRLLRYRSSTRYGDGNHLAVIDSEMPGILQRMGLWRPGDPLPVPAGCSRPLLRHGEEWCQ